jgi:hypothetical protein
VGESARGYWAKRSRYVGKVSLGESRNKGAVYEEGYRLKVYEDLFYYIYNCFFVVPLREVLGGSTKKLALFLLEIETKLSALPSMLDELDTFEPDITVCSPTDPSFKDTWRRVRFMHAHFFKERVQKT